MLFAGWEVRMMENCDRGLENTALGRRPRAAFLRPRSQFFTIRTDPLPVNNIFFFLNVPKFFPKEPEWFRAVNTARSSINWTIFLASKW